MLGSIPNFNNGAVVAVIMLVPSIVSILLLKFLERYNIRYNKISTIELAKNKMRDVLCVIGSAVVLLCVFAIFCGNFYYAVYSGMAVPGCLYSGAFSGCASG